VDIDTSVPIFAQLGDNPSESPCLPTEAPRWRSGATANALTG
jgi:hypothetical protein